MASAQALPLPRLRFGHMHFKGQLELEARGLRPPPFLCLPLSYFQVPSLNGSSFCKGRFHAMLTSATSISTWPSILWVSPERVNKTNCFLLSPGEVKALPEITPAPIPGIVPFSQVTSQQTQTLTPVTLQAAPQVTYLTVLLSGTWEEEAYWPLNRGNSAFRFLQQCGSFHLCLGRARCGHILLM